MSEKVTPRAKDYSQWYLDIVNDAGLAENSDVRGCMVIRPHGYAIWEKMHRALDRLFKDTGHVNAYFPLFIPKSFLAKEEQMAEGFAKECAVVTHYRLRSSAGKIEVDPAAKLEEELIIRPTSETIIWRTYKDWVQSYRDLPLLINQWCNVVRWEMRTRLFLRTAEFLWQEGHTAHATQEEAEKEAHMILMDCYRKFAEEFMAMPVLTGPKTEGQKFPGAVYTLCIEAMMQDGKALQAGTSHFLGQNFAKAFDVKFKNEQNKEEYAWATSWGVSTRLIGGLIMTHSDDNGLVVPPRLAPLHVVIVPMGKTEAERKPCNEAAEKLAKELRQLPRDDFFGYEPLAVKIDASDKSPGSKFTEHEICGVPVRVEIGPKDIEKSACVVARRDVPGKEGKQFGVALAGAAEHIAKLLRDIQKSLYDRAKKFRDERIVTANTLDEFKALFPAEKDEDAGGGEPLKFVYAHWDGTRETEDRVQKEFKATIRCVPFDGPKEKGKCIFTGKDSARRVVFARAY